MVRLGLAEKPGVKLASELSVLEGSDQGRTDGQAVAMLLGERRGHGVGAFILDLALWTFRHPTCLGHSEEPTCQTCILGPLGVVILPSPRGVLGSRLLPSRLFLHMECIRPLEETRPPGCLPIRPTQGPLCQASPCRPLASSPRGPTPDSRR